MNEKMIRKYAKLLVTTGINVQPGQKVVVEACIEGYQFANIFAEEAFKAGAGDVIINYLDQALLKTKSQYMAAEELSKVKNWEVERYEGPLDEGACTIRLEGVNPKLMEDATEAQANAVFAYVDNVRNVMRRYVREAGCRWCIAMVPTYEWAELLFPEMDKDAALDKLWETLLKLCFITEDNDADEAWVQFNERNAERAKKMDSFNIEKLHYTASNGTDLYVELTPHSKFYHVDSSDGIVFNPNIPTEEIYTTPNKFGTNGVVYSTKPLLLGGKSIENFGFRFENGKVVEVIAGEGKEMLESLVATDEGACYLGEAALVEYKSPISQSGLVYYTTLIDENASCHLALGRGLTKFPEPDQDLANFSQIHIDFMVGTEDMNIDGLTRDGQWVPVFRNGNFAF